MAAKKNLSIEEIIAACRAVDGGEGASPTPAAEAAAPAKPAAPAATPAAAAASGAKPSQSMSVEEMMAAARAQTGSGAEASAPAQPAAPAAPAAGGKKPSQSMSVAEMMAAARGQAAGGAKAAPAAKAPAGAAKAAPAAKSAAAKKANPKNAADTGPRDTSSILAAARKSDSEKRGPMSRAEAKGAATAPAKVKAAPPMPERPAYAKAKTSAGADEGRRGALVGIGAAFGAFFGSFMGLGFTSLGVVSGLWGLGLARFLFPNILTEPPSQFKIGFPADFPPDSVVTKFKAQFGVWVVNTEYEGQQQITALMSVCTHLGCTPNWLEGEQKFKCPCHGSGFYKEGINFEGPAPRPLERYAIRISDDGQLEIDKSKTFQQEMGDWKDPSCYVPV